MRLDVHPVPLDLSYAERYKRGNWNIIDFPVLNVFVTDCHDIEAYKSNVREEIDTWLKSLQLNGISDWLILIVETLEGKKAKNLLPRTTVMVSWDWEYSSPISAQLFFNL